MEQINIPNDDSKNKREEVIAETYLKAINEAKEKKNTLLQEFVNTSLQRASLVKREQEILEKLNNNVKSIQNSIEYAYKKMKLNKKTEYSWMFDGKDKFIGTLKPKK